MLDQFTLLDKQVSHNIIHELCENSNNVHESCFKNILVVTDLLLKKNCMEKTNMFFMIKEDQFIHVKCNQLIIDDITVLQNEQKQNVWNGLMNYLKVIEESTCLSNSMLMQLTVNEMYSLFKVVGKCSSFLKCDLCNKVIKSGFENHHLAFCKERKCDFIQMDNVLCNSKSHKSKFHLNFYSNNQIKSVKPIYHTAISEIKMNLIKNKDNFIAFKCDSIKHTLSSILSEFHLEFRIIAKKCICALTFKFCNCFLKIINNCDPHMYFNRKKKNIYYGMKDLKSNKVKLIATIILDYNDSDLKSKINFELIKHIRKHPDFKIIFLSKDDLNFNFIKSSMLNIEKITYHSV